jgi:hypothetical protein
MGQEFLEDKQWSSDSTSSNLLLWSGLTTGSGIAMVDHLRFTQELIRLRWNQPALRGDPFQEIRDKEIRRDSEIRDEITPSIGRARRIKQSNRSCRLRCYPGDPCNRRCWGVFRPATQELPGHELPTGNCEQART